MGNNLSVLGKVQDMQTPFSQYGMQATGAQATNSPMKAVGGYWANPGYQQMQQRLYGGTQGFTRPQGGYMSNAVSNFQPVFNTSKSVAQPSSVTNPFANYRSMSMMPYWMALTRRFMGY